jgi:glucosamine 6-phosphate synthetase-like amidotransferase/phosphosugar isomerase protein
VHAFEGLLDMKRDVILTVPDAHPLLLPVLMGRAAAVAAYHCAICRGAGRRSAANLAKSVTVNRALSQ